MAEKVKEKGPVFQKVKEKIQTAPKELLRRGLLTGTEKLKGQLRDAAEGGQREDTEADRAGNAARMGARLAVDRLVPRKKKDRSWSGEAVPRDVPEAGLAAPDSGPRREPSAPPSGAEPVRIKTREAVHDAPTAEYGRADLPRADQRMVKTKDAYIHRQAAGQHRAERRIVAAPQPRGHIHASEPKQLMIRTKDRSTRPYAVDSERYSRRGMPGQAPEDSPAYSLSTSERGRQTFVRERARQAEVQRAKGQSMGDVTPMLPEQYGAVGAPSQVSPRSTLTAADSGRKAMRGLGTDGRHPIKTARSGRTPVEKPGHQKIKLAVNSHGQSVKAVDGISGHVRQATQTAAQARRRAVEAAGGARRAATTVDRPVVKAAMSALRGAASAIRTAIAPLAAGGGAVVAVVLVLCLVAALIMSPMGLFFSDEGSGGQTVADAVREINQEYTAKLEEIEAGTAHDQLSMSGARAPWPEVLAVYAVKTTSDPVNGQEVVTMTDEKKELLKLVFWDMDQVSSFTSTVPHEDDDGETTTLHITVTAKTADEMADAYGFDASQRQQLTELLSDEYQELWNTILYGIGISSGEIVAVALSQVGNVGGQPYWSWYGFSSRVDWCAIFVSWCANECGYIEAGTMPKFAGCVQGSRWFKERGLWQDRSYEPQPGDIVFFDWNDPGGFSGPQDGVPDHVGIVEKVENGRVYTIEGNSGDSCRQRSYSVGYYEIWGYGCPIF